MANRKNLNVISTNRKYIYTVAILIIISIFIVSCLVVDFIQFKKKSIEKIEENIKNQLYGIGLMIDKDMFNESFFFDESNKSVYQSNSKILLDYAKRMDLHRLYTVASFKNKFYVVNYAYPVYDFSQIKLDLDYSNIEDKFIKELFLKNTFDQPVVNNIEFNKEKFNVIYYLFKSNQNKFVVCGEFTYLNFNNAVYKRLSRNISFGFVFLFLLGILTFCIQQIIKENKSDSSDSIYVDYLTDLPNRKKLFLDIVDTKEPILIIIHINYFKEINNLYGYKFIEFAVKDMTDRLVQILSKGNFKFALYRIQFDEFAVMIDKDMSIDECVIISQYILDNLTKKHLTYKNKEIFVAVTMGIAKNKNKKDKNFRILIPKADIALKKAMQKERSFVIYDETMKVFDENDDIIDWNKRLKKAINDDRMVPFYQSVINNKTKKVEKFECLIRLIDENKNIISPYFFLDIADSSKSYYHITRIMLKKAFATFKELKYDFSINISIDDILNPTTMKLIVEQLESEPNTSKRICFDISESDCIQNLETTKDFIEKVKFYGASVAIQDFGTSYFNFDNVLKLNIDYIKIDSSLIKSISNDKASQLLTKMIVIFCKELKIKTISQFVHSQEVFDKVCELGIDYSQGYYLGEPQIFPKFD